MSFLLPWLFPRRASLFGIQQELSVLLVSFFLISSVSAWFAWIMVLLGRCVCFGVRIEITTGTSEKGVHTPECPNLKLTQQGCIPESIPYLRPPTCRDMEMMQWPGEVI
jgi:hypothetical protein